MKIFADEKALLDSVERGEWKSAGGGKRERTRYTRYAKATFRKDRRLNGGGPEQRRTIRPGDGKRQQPKREAESLRAGPVSSA